MLKLKSVIEDYKSRHLPYKPSENYRHRIGSLAAELAITNGKPVNYRFNATYFRFYAYVYLNPLKPGNYEYVGPSGFVYKFKYEPFYVGKGTGKRAYSHLKEAKNLSKKSHKSNTIRKIWESDREPIVLLTKSRVSDFFAQAIEVDMISAVGRHNKKQGPLTNGTDGGDGASGRTHLVSSKAKMSAARKLRVSKPLSEAQLIQLDRLHAGRIGLSHTKRTKERMRNKALGRTHSLESRYKMRMAKLGKPRAW